MHTPEHTDEDAALLRVGRLIGGDAVLGDTAWDGYALIVRYEAPGIARRITGFRYIDGGGFEAATPRDETLGDALDALRDATRIDGKAPWSACVVRLRRHSGRLHADFEYENPAQWDITPATLQAVVERARPRG